MQNKLLKNGTAKTYAVIFDKRDEFMACLKQFARDESLAGSHFTAIGAFSDVVLGYFDRTKMEYKKIPVPEQVEVLSLIGDIALDAEAQPKIHAHVVLGKADGSTVGGHILEANVWPTLELVLEESPRHLQRHTDEETGLALIDIEASEGTQGNLKPGT